MNKSLSLLLAAVLTLCVAGCANHPVTGSSAISNGGVFSVTWSPQSGTGTTGWLECAYLTSGDATNHPTAWQKGTSSTGPWSPTTPVSVGSAPVSMYTGSTYRDYYVKFTALASGDTPPPVTLVRVKCNQKTTITITYP